MFIVVEYGVPYADPSLCEGGPLNRLALMERSWMHCCAFDARQRYRGVPSHEPKVSLVERMLAHTVYNPKTDVTLRWEACGPCELPEIIAEVERGLESDDDFIQQWFGAEDVLKLLRSASTFDEMVDAVRCVCGEFEKDSRLRAIVDRVLGPEPGLE
jgi:hypothetical protein